MRRIKTIAARLNEGISHSCHGWRIGLIVSTKHQFTNRFVEAVERGAGNLAMRFRGHSSTMETNIGQLVGVINDTGFGPPAVQPIGGVNREIRRHQIRLAGLAVNQFADMVGFNGIKRALVIALMVGLRAIRCGDGDGVVFWPRVPWLLNAQRRLAAFYRDVPWQFGINGAMQLRLEAVIAQTGLRFGIDLAGRQPARAG